jgi:hypothetical protein
MTSWNDTISKKSSDRITEKEYQQLLKRLVKGAEYLDHPFISTEDFKKGMELYNCIEKRIQRYQDQNPVETYPAIDPKK